MLGATALLLSLVSAADTLPRVSWHDNLVPAGRESRGAVRLDLEIRRGMWHPNGADRAGTNILAFAEVGKGPTTPGPLLRVRQGTRVDVNLVNHSSDTIAVHGFCARAGVTQLDSLLVLPGATVRTTFVAELEGTFFYWGARAGTLLVDRAFDDAMLTGALVVDPATGPVPPDRILLIDNLIERLMENGELTDAGDILAINGRPWPFTERLKHAVGDSIRWRLINSSQRNHPMHLHGFYFRVDAAGDWQQDTALSVRERRMAVTELMPPGSTRTIVWSPDRPGGWLFHCHLSFHAQMNSPLGAEWKGGQAYFMSSVFGGTNADAAHHVEHHMGGLMLVTNVTPRGPYPVHGPAQRTLRMQVVATADTSMMTRRYGYRMDDGTPFLPGMEPGQAPLILIQKNQPTDVVIVNNTPDATSIHWHGLEIDSYSDGVVGVGGYAHMPTPPIMPGDSFVARITVPRSGTFMYHTHMSDINQQAKGLTGPIVVLDDLDSWDPAHERVVLAHSSLNMASGSLDVQVNQHAVLPPDTLVAGDRYRFRLMNLTLEKPGLTLSFNSDSVGARWRIVAKDGFDILPSNGRVDGARVPLSIGETTDIAWRPLPGGSGWLELRSRAGDLFLRQRVEVIGGPAAPPSGP
jgi:FtsP/CotA-like multicopper oxidase with cupredoxin domain